MKVAEVYSHLGGEEILLVRKRAVWDEVMDVIASIDAEACRTKVSKEKNRQGTMLYSPTDMNSAFKNAFSALDWHEDRVAYAVCSDQLVLEDPMFFQLSYEQQRAQLDAQGKALNTDYFYSYNQTDFVKDQVAVEVQFGKYSFVAYDLFVKHLAFFQQRKIGVGIEILPMKALQTQMSSGVGYYEGELFNLARQGRGSPPVPLIVIGITA